MQLLTYTIVMKTRFFLRDFGLKAKPFSQLAWLIVPLLLMSSSWSGEMSQEGSSTAEPSLTAAQMPSFLTQAEQLPTNLPDSVQNAVINAAANLTGISANQFQIIEAEQRNWPNSCLGLYEPEIACTQVIVPGWRVVVQADHQEWSFHTDGTGDLVKLANSPNSPGEDQGYVDLEGHWAQSCIQRLGQQGTISGYPDNTFRPDSSITRAEYAALLNQAFPDVPEGRETLNFVDVPSDYWGEDAIQTAYRKGFVSGYPNQEFHPDELVSRVEMFVALASGLDHSTPENVSGILAAVYGDAAAIPAYATEEIAALTQQGAIVKESLGGNRLNPEGAATRAQVAATLCELMFEDSGIPAGYVVTPVED